MSQVMLKSMVASAGARMAVLPITAVASALTTYLIVGYAGAEMFGYVSLIATLFLLLPFADLGLGAAIVNRVAGSSTDPDVDGARALTRSAFIALVFSASGLILLALAAAATGALARFLGLGELDAASTNIAVFTAIAPFAISLPFGVGQRVLLGLRKNHLVNIYSATAPVTTVALTWLMIQADVPPLLLATASSLGVLASSVVAFVVSLRVSGWGGRFFRRPAQATSRRELWSAAAPMIVIAIAVPVGQQSGRLIISRLGTATELAEYAVAFQFYLPTLSVAATAGVALWPIFAGTRANNRKPLIRALGIMAALGTVLGLGYGILIRPIASIVTHSEVTVDPSMAWVLALQLLIMSVHQAAATLLTTPRMLGFQAACAVAMAGLSIIFGVLLVPELGGTGVALGAVIGLVLGQVVPGLIASWRVTRHEK